MTPERGKRPSGTTELHNEQSGPQVPETIVVPLQLVDHDCDLETQRDREGVLSMRSTGHWCRTVLESQSPQVVDDVVHASSDQIERVAQLEHDRRVHDVLCCGAPVHI